MLNLKNEHDYRFSLVATANSCFTPKFNGPYSYCQGNNYDITVIMYTQLYFNYHLTKSLV